MQALRIWIAISLLWIALLSGCGAEATSDLPPTGAPSEGGVFVNDVELMIMESFPVQVRAVIQGDLADGCTSIQDIETQRDVEDRRFTVRIETTRDDDAICTQALVPFEESIDLDVKGLPAGTYTVDVHGETATFTLEVDNVLEE
jgi:inhibitor of cysteine peptidase